MREKNREIKGRLEALKQRGKIPEMVDRSDADTLKAILNECYQLAEDNKEAFDEEYRSTVTDAINVGREIVENPLLYVSSSEHPTWIKEQIVRATSLRRDLLGLIEQHNNDKDEDEQL